MLKLRDSYHRAEYNMDIITENVSVKNCAECPFMIFKNGTAECIAFIPTVVSCQILREYSPGEE